MTSLVKTIDKQLADLAVRHPSQRIRGVFVVFCNDDPGLRQQLQTLAAKEGLKQVVLCATNAAGPPQYKVAREADLTAVIYATGIPARKVAANVPLRKGELNETSTKAILKEIAQVLPK